MHHVRKPIDILFNVLSTWCCSEYRATAAFVQKVLTSLIVSVFVMHVDIRKLLRCPLNDNNPHTGHPSKAIMVINIWIFLKDSKSIFSTSPSQNGWIINITVAQHVWRAVKEAGFAPET
jgi:hypothetical protein